VAGKKAGKWCRVFVEGYNLTTKVRNVPLSSTYNKVESGGFTQDMAYLIGRGDGAITLGGLFDDTDNSTHEALQLLASGNTTQLVTVAIGDNALPAQGDITASLQATQATYVVTPDLNDIVSVSAEYAAKGVPIEWGVLLDDDTITGDGSTSSLDQGGQTTNGAVGYCHITALSAGDTITVVIEDSANDADWSTLITFTLDGTALDAERIEVSGTIDQYVRVTYTTTGTGISFPVAVALIRG
jgi:hypothetical protein